MEPWDREMLIELLKWIMKKIGIYFIVLGLFISLFMPPLVKILILGTIFYILYCSYKCKQRRMEQEKRDLELEEQKEREALQQKKKQLEIEREKQWEATRQKLLEEQQKNYQNAIKIVSKYCNRCGLLIYDKEKTKKYCAVCGEMLFDARQNVHLIEREPDCWNKNTSMSYEHAESLYRQGCLAEVLAYVKKDAEENDPRALYWVALCHKNIDVKVYMSNLMRAVELNYPAALFELGINYYNGEYVEKNNVLSQKYLEKVALLDGSGGIQGGWALHIELSLHYVNVLNFTGPIWCDVR